MEKFKNVETAAIYLTQKYGDDWYNCKVYEDIQIDRIRVIVNYGLRFDPISDRQYEKYEKLAFNPDYKKYRIRLS